jgi:predicted DNA-binding transcriptional regulator AlpA
MGDGGTGGMEESRTPTVIEIPQKTATRKSNPVRDLRKSRPLFIASRMWLLSAPNGNAGVEMATSEVYLTEDEFAGRYHLGRRTVQRWRQTGEGPSWVRLGRRRILYRLSDVEAWTRSRTYQHRADELAHAAA